MAVVLRKSPPRVAVPAFSEPRPKKILLYGLILLVSLPAALLASFIVLMMRMMGKGH